MGPNGEPPLMPMGQKIRKGGAKNENFKGTLGKTFPTNNSLKRRLRNSVPLKKFQKRNNGEPINLVGNPILEGMDRGNNG